MRICLVTFDFPPLVGGIGTQTYDLASYLVREGVDVHVLTSGNEDEEDYGSHSFRITRLKVPLHSSLRKMTTFQFRVWQWLKVNNEAFDVIHFQEISGFLYFLFGVFGRLNNNTIEQFHHSQVAEFLFHLKFLLKAPRQSLPYLFLPVSIFEEYFSLRKAKQVITVSNSSRSTLLSWRINSSKIVVIPNALSESFLRHNYQKRSHSGAIKFLYVGRLVPRKGVDVLIKAIAILSKRGIDDFHVDIVGEGPIWRYCQKMIQRGDIKHCHMWGLASQRKLDELYQQADCFLCPSRLEGFGIVLLEAGANGLAIIASDIPVFREIYDDEVLYFRQGNPADLAEKMGILIGDRDLVSDLQVKGREKVKNYYWQTMVKDYMEIYHKMVREPDEKGGCA